MHHSDLSDHNGAITSWCVTVASFDSLFQSKALRMLAQRDEV